MIVKRNFARIVRRLAFVAAVVFVVYQFVFFYSSSQQKVAEKAEEVKAVIRLEKAKEKLEQALKEVDPEVTERFMTTCWPHRFMFMNFDDNISM